MLGRGVPGTEVRIVDDAGRQCAERTLGHIEIRGENVTAGYYASTASPRPPEGWLDTGDLGLICDGQLVVTGRAKDLVIVNGQNFYPHDFERLAQQVADVDANRVAAAGVRLPGEESEGLAVFVLHRGELEGFVAKAWAIRRAIAEQTGVEVGAVVPVAQIPKTTSGKLQRYLLARAFEQGSSRRSWPGWRPCSRRWAGPRTGQPKPARRLPGCRRSPNVLYRTDTSDPGKTCSKSTSIRSPWPACTRRSTVSFRSVSRYPTCSSSPRWPTWHGSWMVSERDSEN